MKNLILGSINRLDLFVWCCVLLFFTGSALLFHGQILASLIGATGIIAEMVTIGIAIEVIIECLKKRKGLGTLVGFITNGPEALCLLVGLLYGDVIFAASTPLGSNYMNPILLFIAALICRQTIQTFSTKPTFTLTTILGTALFAGIFFALPPSAYPYWVAGALLFSLLAFLNRPHDHEPNNEDHAINPRLWFLPALLVLTVAGYFLGDIVTFTATNSHAPRGLIGFLVLSTLTSWPEFKSCLALLTRGRHLAAILNITVSNITNIWLAAAGVTTYLLSR